MSINQRAFSRHSCKFQGIIYRNNSTMSMLGWIVRNLPFFTPVQDKLALGRIGLMIGNQFSPGTVKVWITADLATAPEPSFQLVSFTFQTIHLTRRTESPPDAWRSAHISAPAFPVGVEIYTGASVRQHIGPYFIRQWMSFHLVLAKCV